MIVANRLIMRISTLVFIVSLFAASPSLKAEQASTEAPEPPDIKILDFGVIAVSKESAKIGPQPSAGRTMPPRGPNEDGMISVATKEPSAIANRPPLGRSVPQSQADDDWEKPGESAGPFGPDHYEIHITVKNTGTNTVKSVDWQYTFMDAEGEKELKHFRIRSKKKIPPNGMGILTKSFLPALSASEDPKPEFARGKQRVAILRVIYDDDSSWESKSGSKPNK